jgi:hypothetical protein
MEQTERHGLNLMLRQKELVTVEVRCEMNLLMVGDLPDYILLLADAGNLFYMSWLYVFG